MNKDDKFFNNKSLSDILEEIYTNSNDKNITLKKIIDSLSNKMMEDTESNAMLLPMLKELIELSIKNDDQLVKIASVVQRIITTESGNKILPGVTNNTLILSNDERTEILNRIASGKKNE